MCKILFIVCSASFVLSLVIKNGDAAADNVTLAVDNDISIYYDPSTSTKLPLKSIGASRLPPFPIRFTSQGPPCTCNNLNCGCCTGINITMMNFNRLACTNVTFVPEEFALDFNVAMDKDIIMNSRLTAKNPPPICVPLYGLPAVTFCVRFFNLHFNENKFNACIDFETRIVQWPIFILHFNCLRIGADGVSWSKPNSNDTKPIVANITNTDFNDKVNFEFSDRGSNVSNTRILIPEIKRKNLRARKLKIQKLINHQ